MFKQQQASFAKGEEYSFLTLCVKGAANFSP